MANNKKRKEKLDVETLKKLNMGTKARISELGMKHEIENMHLGKMVEKFSGRGGQESKKTLDKINFIKKLKENYGNAKPSRLAFLALEPKFNEEAASLWGDTQEIHTKITVFINNHRSKLK